MLKTISYKNPLISNLTFLPLVGSKCAPCLHRVISDKHLESLFSIIPIQQDPGEGDGASAMKKSRWSVWPTHTQPYVHGLQ